MSTVTAVSMVLTVTLFTYLSRAGVILFVGNRQLPEQFERALKNVAPAVLSALVVTLVAGDAGVDGISVAEVVGLGSAGVAGRLSKNLIVALTAGMVVFWLTGWAYG